MKKKCKCEKGKVWIQTDLSNYAHGSFQKHLEEMIDEGYDVYLQIAGTPPPPCGQPPKPPC